MIRATSVDRRLSLLGTGCTLLGAACLLLAACSSNPQKPTMVISLPSQPTGAEMPPAAVTSPSATAPIEQPELVLSPWDRLRRRFVMPSCDFNPRVQRWARLYSQRSGQLSASLSAVMPFLLLVLDQIEQRDLPGEFAFLPYIESNYTPLASSGDRAAGIWQLMPDTGREAGLQITPEYDGRLDITASTDAALNLLQRYQQEFGDWRLANMAFNAGQYRVKQLVGDSKVQRSSAELGRVPVRAGTHEHLAKLLAVACIVSDPQRYHVELPEPDPADALTLIQFPAPVDLGLAARLANIDVKRLRVLNPGLLRAHMPVDGPLHLLLPASRREAIEQTLAKLPQHAWRDWHEVELRQTQSLGVLASESDLDVTTLAEINRLAGDAPLARGTRLLLPSRAGFNSDLLQEFLPHAQQESSASTLTVHAGDSLWSIAHHHRIPIGDLLRWNRLSRSATLQLGQRLLLRDTTGSATSAAVSAAR